MKTFSFLAFLIFGSWSILFRKDNNFMEKRVRPFFKDKGIKAVAWRRSVKKAFLEILQNSLESTCHRASFLIKFQTLFKKGLWRRCFPVNLAKFLRTPFFTENLLWLLLKAVFSLPKKDFLQKPMKLLNVFVFLFFVFPTNKAFLINFFYCAPKPGFRISLFTAS